jgi:DNA-binding MarR family transcriptional regulator
MKQARKISASPAAVADRLHSAAIHLLRRVRRQDVASGLGPAQLSALSVLVFAGSMGLGELAAAEQVRPPTMSRIVGALVRQKLVERASDAGDARRIRLRATTRGRKLLERGRHLRIAYLAGRFQKLPAEELSALGKAAEILESTLRNWSEQDT